MREEGREGRRGDGGGAVFILIQEIPETGIKKKHFKRAVS